MHNRINDASESNTLSNRDQEHEIESEQFAREKKPLPENITGYIQKVRDELKRYEENKKYYEKKRKKEIVLELIVLLEEHEYPKDWLRLIIAQELGDYISISYIEKILAEKYPDEKKVKKQSTRQTEEFPEIPQNDDKNLIEVLSTGTSIISNNGNASDNPNTSSTNTIEATTGFKTDVVRQAEEGTREIVKALQKQIRELQTKCYQLDQLAKEESMWKVKYSQLLQESRNLSSYESKIIKGTTEIEFGSEFLPLTVQYNPRTNQFSARIPQGVIERILAVLRRRG